MRTIRDIFGPPSHQPFAFYDPDSSSVRTSQATLLSDSTPSSPTLPRWGSMCGGALYELRTPELLTSGLGSSGLLGTPNAHERTHSPRAVDHGIQLANQVSVMFQTPSAADAMGGHLSRGGARSHELLLKGQVKALLPTATAKDPGFKNRTPVTKDGETPEHGAQRWYDAETGRLMQKGLPQVLALLPTPAVNDMGAGKTVEQWDSWTDEMRERHGNGNGHGRSLSIEAQRLLPTPNTSDGHGPARQDRASGTKTQFGMREWALSHGDFTNPRSEGGSSSTDQPPGQLTIEAA